MKWFFPVALAALLAGCTTYGLGYSSLLPDSFVRHRLYAMTPIGSSIEEVRTTLSARVEGVQDFNSRDYGKYGRTYSSEPRGHLIRAAVSSSIVSIACGETRFAIWRFDKNGRLVRIDFDRLTDCL